MANSWEASEKWSIIINGTLTLVAILLAMYSYSSKDFFLLAISMGALGGLVHEFAQSGGKLMFFKKESDGYYLGSLSGIALGAVAGILVVRGKLEGIETANVLEVSIDVFMAGLGLKGITEAAAGNAVPSKEEKPGP